MINQKDTYSRITQSLKKRHKAERRFRLYGILSILFAIACLLFLFGDIFRKGYGAFTQTKITQEIFFDSKKLKLTKESTQEEIQKAKFNSFFKKALREVVPSAKTRKEKKALYALFSSENASILKQKVLNNPEIIGTKQKVTLLASDDVDMYYKYAYQKDESISRLNDYQETLINTWITKDKVTKEWNSYFFTNSDSRDPELAGIKGAVIGSLLTLLVALAISFPIAIATAVYLEEFAPKNKLTQFIEININNLAAVPSVIFGLLGLAVFINFFGMPRSIPLVGGLVLSLMTLPTIIISSRAAIKAVPPSIRDAALGLGASKVQTILHHVIPLSMPGMLTGTIIGMAQALGETAPLLMIGMVAFIVDSPSSITDPSTVLPVQIFLWSDSPERAFIEKTSAAIMVLLGFLILMNSLAVILRKKLEKRW